METGNNNSAVVRLQQVSDESLINNLSGKYHLSLQTGEGVCSSALLSLEQNKYVLLESFSYAKSSETEALSKFKSAEWFNHVSSVSLAVVSEKITLVPEPIFDENVKQVYANFNFQVEENKQVISVKIRSAGCFAVFALAEEKQQLYRSFFSGIKILHTATPFLESVLVKDKNENTENVYLNIRPKSMELAVTKNGVLIYYNTFAYTTSEDVIYYLLFAFEQLKLNPETVALQLMGEVEKNDGIYTIIHKYVRHVNFMKRNNRFDYSYRFGELPEQAFYTLFSQYLCA